MKRRITLSLVLTLSVLLSLVSLPATAQGQQRQRFRADTGVITVGGQTIGGQILRITVAPTWSDPVRVRFRRMQYMAEGCNSDGVCPYTVAAQSVTAPMTLNADESVSIDIQGNGNGVRVVVESNSRDAKVIVQIIDMVTNEPLGGGNEVLWQ